MDKPQKGNSFKPSNAQDKGDQEMLEGLAQCVVEAANHEIQGEGEPFEQYAYQLRARLQRDNKLFFTHFMQGYAVLLEQLQTGL